MTGLPPSDIDLQLIRAAELQPVPWKNGGGTTREIAVEPPGSAFDTFLWRISMADVDQAGPFSTFEGIDRIIAVIQGGAMVLNDTATGTAHVLQRAEPFSFPGETPISAELPDGPTQDFNLMWRRESAHGQMKAWRTAERLCLEDGSTVLHCIAGSYYVSLPYGPDLNYLLNQGDTLRLTLPDSATLSLDIRPLQADAILLDSRIRALPANATHSEPRP